MWHILIPKWLNKSIASLSQNNLFVEKQQLAQFG